MPSEVTFWSWAIRGLGGTISILEGMAEHGPRMTQAHYDELDAMTERMIALMQSLENRVSEYGATFHGPETDRTIAGTTTAQPDAEIASRSDRSYGSTGSAGGDPTAGTSQPTGSVDY
jgi:hypothetical protein